MLTGYECGFPKVAAAKKLCHRLSRTPKIDLDFHVRYHKWQKNQQKVHHGADCVQTTHRITKARYIRRHCPIVATRIAQSHDSIITRAKFTRNPHHHSSAVVSSQPWRTTTPEPSPGGVTSTPAVPLIVHHIPGMTLWFSIFMLAIPP